MGVGFNSGPEPTQMAIPLQCGVFEGDLLTDTF
jgi:hypothetical protein